MTTLSYDFYKFELFEEANQSFTKRKLLHEEIMKFELYKNHKFWESCLVKILEEKLSAHSSSKSSVVIDLTRSRRSLVNDELNQCVKKMLDCGMEKKLVQSILDAMMKKYMLREEDKEEIEV